LQQWDLPLKIFAFVNIDNIEGLALSQNESHRLTAAMYVASNMTSVRYVTNQPPKANSAFHPSGVGKRVPASAGKAKAGMVHFVSR